MPQVFFKITEKCERSPKEIFLLATKECDKRQSIGKAALLFNLDKMTLYQHLNNIKKFDQNVHLGMVLSVRLTLFFY